MRTLLYKDGEKVITFAEVKDNYMAANNSELPIPDDEMLLISFLLLKQNGGTLHLIQDDILAWCNDYSAYNEADRYLSQYERDNSVKNLYECICSNDSYIKEIKTNLYDDAVGTELLERLNELIAKTNSQQMRNCFFTKIDGISNSYTTFFVLDGKADDLISALLAESVDKKDIFDGNECEDYTCCSIMDADVSFAVDLSSHIEDKVVIGFCGWDTKEMYIAYNGNVAMQNKAYHFSSFDTKLECSEERWYSFRITIEDMNGNKVEIDSGGDCSAEVVKSFFEQMMLT